MKINKDLIALYERVLTGQRIHIDTCFFKGTEGENNDAALQILRYAIRTYLYNWTPQELQLYLDKEVIQMLHLEDILKHIRIPKELEVDDYWYIAHLVYPNIIKFDEDEIITKAFEDVIDGRKKKLPKNYFIGQEGKSRLSICVRFLLETEMFFTSQENMYYQFSIPKIIEILKKYTLYDVYKEHYDTPIELLHESLADEQKNNFYYNLYQLKCIIENIS